MIYSMTAFARNQQTSDLGIVVCEMRSINHRYLEMALHLPEILRPLEMPIRERIRKKLKRGKVECTLRYQPSIQAAGSMFSINTVLAKELCVASEEIGEMLRHAAPVYPTDILRFPGVLETHEADVNLIQQAVLTLVEKTLNDLVEVRGREGSDLNTLFVQRLDAMRQELTKVRDRLPHVMVDQQDRLLKRFSEAKLELDPARLEQEMVIFAQKIDVAEEIDRTETHITEIKRVLKEGGAVGRRLDFLLQELNREANTMGSKSVDPVITHAAVEIKVLIEQVREQMQNVE